MKLRYFLIFVFCLMAAFPILLLRAWPQSTALETRIADVQAQQVLTARNLSIVLDRYHSDVTATFDLLVASPNIEDAQQLTDVLENLAFRHICLVDFASGQRLKSIATTHIDCPEQVPTEKLARLQGIAVDGETRMGAVALSLLGENAIHLVRRIGDQMAFGLIDTSYFEELGAAFPAGGGGQPVIVDQAGNLLYHPVTVWAEERRNIAHMAPVSRVLAGEFGSALFSSPTIGADVIVGFTQVSRAGWGVLIMQPISELTAAEEQMRRSTLAVLVAGAVTACLLALLVSVVISRPVERVSSAAHRIAEGDLTPTDGTSDWLETAEVRELKRSFDYMVARLRKSIATINTLAFQDSVTKLANRTYFRRRLGGLLDQGALPNGVMYFVDLDGFKLINDTSGHDVGDKVLAAIGWRLMGVVRRHRGKDVEEVGQAESKPNTPSKAIVARIGGDEFAIFLPDADQKESETIAAELVKAASEPIAVGTGPVLLSASVGLARYPDDARSYSDLLKAADLALYDAKHAGKNRYHRFQRSMLDEVHELRRLSEELVDALATGQLLPYFQPQFKLDDMSLSGVEALVRWQHPVHGLLEPEAFFEAARDANLIKHIDQFVLRQAVSQTLELHAQGIHIPRLALNLSRERLEDPEFVEQVAAYMPLPFELGFELVESQFLDDLDQRTAWQIDQLIELGVEFDLDDFGSRHASILALLNLRPKHIKVEPNLIARMGQGMVPDTLVKSIIDMGHALDIDIIAEGVEGTDHVSSLRDLGCDVVQGFVVGHPMPKEQFVTFYRDMKDSA